MNEQVQTVQGAPLFNPLSPEFIANPYPHYHRLRAVDPVHLAVRLLRGEPTCRRCDHPAR